MAEESKKRTYVKLVGSDAWGRGGKMSASSALARAQATKVLREIGVPEARALLIAGIVEVTHLERGREASEEVWMIDDQGKLKAGEAE